MVDICVCGHDAGDHTGLGICTKCECVMFTKAAPVEAPKPTEREIKGLDHLHNMTMDCSNKVREMYGEKGVEGFNVGFNITMHKQFNPLYLYSFIVSHRFDEELPYPENRVGFLIGLKVARIVQEKMVFMKGGGDIEQDKFEYIVVK